MTTNLFLSAFGTYIFFLILLGWFVSRKQRGGQDFLLAGRSLPVFLIIGTTLGTLVGTGSSMGAVGFGYGFGWAGVLYGIGGAIGILLLALLFAPVRRLRFMTMSEELSYYVGAHPLVKNIVAVLILLACIGWLGAHILGGGLYLAWIAGIDLAWAKTLVALGFAIYVIVGGYRAVVWTDTLQAIVLFFGFILMAGFALHQVGGWSALVAAQPVVNRSFLGMQALGWLPSLSLVAVIAVGVLATPSFRQRIYSGRSVRSVRQSFVATGILYLFFSVVPAIIGMAAFALNPALENRNFAFPFLAVEVLPLWIGLVVLIAGLSATMSSASSDAIAGVSILIRDVFSLLAGRVPSADKVILFSRIGLALVIGVAWLMAMLSDDLISYITRMIATLMAGMFTCGLLGRFWPRYNWQGAIASLLVGVSASLAMIVSGLDGVWGNPIIPAVASALLAGVVISLMTPAQALSNEQALARISAERDTMERGEY
ncbi:sodium:solute symporter family protein [Marinimicrobium alkaliphilum]|uniref:sodium:solute symporter family protein n=1 Tax=Marinimicrobium alkaliphilum TaxID=2202654 RepID=UPI000DB97510|nr:sodium:solute symporter family protein [Marinimicrobium alkaliphilum]